MVTIILKYYPVSRRQIRSSICVSSFPQVFASDTKDGLASFFKMASDVSGGVQQYFVDRERAALVNPPAS